MWVIIVRALYGLKSAIASFRAHLINTLRTMGFKATFSDRDVWIRKNFLLLSQEHNNSADSGTNTDTTALRFALNYSNSTSTSNTPYYEYICT